jgi:hypothetical protein
VSCYISGLGKSCSADSLNCLRSFPDRPQHLNSVVESPTILPPGSFSVQCVF